MTNLHNTTTTYALLIALAVYALIVLVLAIHHCYQLTRIARLSLARTNALINPDIALADIALADATSALTDTSAGHIVITADATTVTRLNALADRIRLNALADALAVTSANLPLYGNDHCVTCATPDVACTNCELSVDEFIRHADAYAAQQSAYAVLPPALAANALTANAPIVPARKKRNRKKPAAGIVSPELTALFAVVLMLAVICYALDISLLPALIRAIR